MTSLDLSINKDLVVEVREFGAERTRVIVCDGVLDSTHELRRFASNEADFVPEGHTAYPGIRARLPQAYVTVVSPLVHRLLTANYALEEGSRMTIPAGYFSLVTMAPESLTAEQRLPHFDSPKSSYFAVMQYINDDNFGGTSFYQHRQTGYENIGTGRQARYLKVLQSEAPSNAGKGYIIDSDACFERIGGVSYQPNRLVIYPSTLLHSGDIVSATNISADPATGRLTANLFVDYRS